MARERLWEDLEALYAELDRELGVLRPLCQRSGRCCRFKEAGHQLWTTGIELDYLVDHAGTPERPASSEGSRDSCPYLKDGLCGVRDHRMLGCRIYFCDPAYQAAMGPLYEKYHSRMKDLHRRHGLAYRYEEFLTALARREEPAR